MNYLFVMQISPSIILLSLYVGFASQRRAIIHAASLIQTVNYIKKRTLQNWLVMSHSQTCVAHAHWKPNYHNQNFMILADSLHKVMSKS